MSYGVSYGAQQLRSFAAEYERREEALKRLAFCYDIYLEFNRDGHEATEHMDPLKSTEQLLAAVRNALDLPPE